jgi:serine protease Do
VAADSPAQKAGIRKGDVIVEFDGERIRSARQLTRVVQETPAGRAVQASLLRDGQRTPVTITPSDTTRFSFEGFPGMDNLLGDYNFRAFKAIPPAVPAPPAPPAPPAFRFDELVGRANRLGVTVDSLSSQLAEYFGTKSGVLVTSVYDNSAAAKAGLKAGDVITSFNGAAVDNVTEVRRRIQDLREGDEFTIEVMRDRKSITLKGKAERTEPRRRTYRTIL